MYQVQRSQDYLEHHGILGQKWGKKNGPPYPIGSEDHSTAEKNAGWKKSLGGGRNEELYGKKQNLKSARKAYNKAYNKYSYVPSKKNLEELLSSSKNLKTAKQDYKAEKTKDEMNKGESKKKYTPQEIQNHRDKMIRSAVKSKDPFKKKVYEEATDQQIEKDIENRENHKKALIAGAAVVGTVAAAYLLYKAKEAGAFDVLKGKNPTLDKLLDRGINLDTAAKLMEVSKKGKLLNDQNIGEITKALINDIDVTFKEGSRFSRVDFHKDFDITKAGKNIFMAPGMSDNAIYKRVLPNRSGLSEGRFNYFLDATKELRMPSISNTKKIIDELYANPEFEKQVKIGLEEMIKKNSGADVIPKSLLDNTYNNIISAGNRGGLRRGMGDNTGKAYAAITAIGGGNSILNETIEKAFKDHGYNAIADIHDIIDGLSDLPMITLTNDNIVVAGKEFVGRL